MSSPTAEDDLDLYLFFCESGTPDNCAQLAQSGGFTSDEENRPHDARAGPCMSRIVHGFETDQVAGGPGTNYFPIHLVVRSRADDVGNLDSRGTGGRRTRETA